MSSSVRLGKYHGLGNDFLVWLDGDVDRGPDAARRWCERRRGVGADGLLVARSALSGGWQMVLFNADGSRAEMSGNGIRCFVHAAGEGRPGVYDVQTDAGPRQVTVAPSPDPLMIQASVVMGEVRQGAAPGAWPHVGSHPDRPVAHLDLGNPHTVVGVEDVGSVELALIGSQVPDVNLEVIEPGPEPHAITMRVHERGSGITEACGTGACAGAWAAVQWGLVPASSPEVLVHMDGGDAVVRLNDPAPGMVTLVGPSVKVADLEVWL